MLDALVMSDQSHDVYKPADWLQTLSGSKDDIIKPTSRVEMLTDFSILLLL